MFIPSDYPDAPPLLRTALQRAGFSHARLQEALGIAAAGFVDLTSGPLVMWNTRGGTEFETLVRLLVIGAAVPLTAADRALAPLGARRALAAGLLKPASIGDEAQNAAGPWVRSAIAIVPFEDLLLAADFARRELGPVPHAPDHVMGVGRSSAALARFALRDLCHPPSYDTAAPPARMPARVLDLGCGCGFLGLKAAAHAATVIATDLNPRAAALARLSAAISGIENIQVREGSLFEPVGADRFDLIVTNPPFVISPESGLIYRDAAATTAFSMGTHQERRSGDEFCRRIASLAPAHLSEGGTLAMMLNWSETREQPWPQRMATWAPPDAQTWLIRTDSQPIDQYASMWIRHTLAGQPGWTEEHFFERFDAWMGYFGSLGIDRIHYGFLIVRAASPAFFATDDLPSEHIDRGLVSINRSLAGRATLARLTDNDDPAPVLAVRWRLATDLRMLQTLAPGPAGFRPASATLALADGARPMTQADPAHCDIMLRCNGRQTLIRLVEEAASMTGIPAARLATDVARLARVLIRDGALLDAAP